jgi:pentose-5-phosphate-3-epimerase
MILRQTAGCLPLLFALSGIGADPVAALTAVNNHTPCSVAVFAFDFKDKTMVLEVGQFIADVFGQLDQIHTDFGDIGIMVQPDDDAVRTLVAASVEFCRQHPEATIYSEAAVAYRGMRATKVRFGDR